MSSEKNELTELAAVASAAVVADAAGTAETSKGEIVAIAAALFVSLGALVLGVLFGSIEMSRHTTVYNWPLIAALITAVVYAWLFVALYSNVVTNSRKLDLLLKR